MTIKWPDWLGEKNRFCPVGRIVVWIKRATGIYYRDFPPLPTDPIVHPDCGGRLKRKSSEIVREVERLEEELRRLGIRSPLWRG